jgi:hypothetical protein
MHRTPLRTIAAFVVLAIATAPATSHAQFGGLIKRKMKEKAVSAVLPQPDAGADTQATRRSAEEADRKARQTAWAHPTAISATNLGSFVTAIRAEQAERAKAATSPNSPLTRATQYSAAQKQCAHDLALNDSTSKRIQAELTAKVQAGKADAIAPGYQALAKTQTDRLELSRRCSALKQPAFTDAELQMVRAEDAHEDSAGAAAGGFTTLEYGRLRERVIAYVLMPAHATPSGYTAPEIAAIDARRAELRKLLANDFASSGQRVSMESASDY